MDAVIEILKIVGFLFAGASIAFVAVIVWIHLLSQ